MSLGSWLRKLEVRYAMGSATEGLGETSLVFFQHLLSQPPFSLDFRVTISLKRYGMKLPMKELNLMTLYIEYIVSNSAGSVLRVEGQSCRRLHTHFSGFFGLNILEVLGH